MGPDGRSCPMSDLPAGFTLDKPSAGAGGLPPGFTVDKKEGGPQKEESTLGSLWDGLKNFGSGVARGVAGEGVPAGKASEDPGGRSEFGGRMVGAGARSVLDGLWDAIKT